MVGTREKNKHESLILRKAALAHGQHTRSRIRGAGEERKDANQLA